MHRSKIGPLMSEKGSFSTDQRCLRDVRFSNRPFRVKHFQTIRRCSVDVAHGLALLFGIGTKALPSWDPRTRWNNLCRGLAIGLMAGPSGHANSPHPSSREGHHSTARWRLTGVLPYRVRTSSNHRTGQDEHRRSGRRWGWIGVLRNRPTKKSDPCRTPVPPFVLRASPRKRSS